MEPESFVWLVLEVLLRPSLAVANLDLGHHALRARQSGIGLGYGDEEDGEIFWEFCDVAHKGAREEGKDTATVDRRNASRCCDRFVEEGLSFGGYLLGVKFKTEECWIVGGPVAVD